MTKKYNSPMLTVVSIRNNDIITNSTDEVYYRGNYDSGITIGAGDRMGREDWDAGY